MSGRWFERYSGCCGSNSSRFRRISRSRTSGSSSRGVSPFPPPSDGNADIEKALEEVMKFLDSVQDGVGETDEKLIIDAIHTAVKDNASLYGQVLDRVGAAANGRIPRMGDETTDGNHVFHELSYVLKDVGHLHWAGACLLIIGLILDRFSKARKNSEDLQRCTVRLRDFGKKVVRLYSAVEQLENSESLKTLRKAMQIICDYEAACRKMSETRPLWSRCFFAETEHEKLAGMHQEIDRLYQELICSGVCDIVMCGRMPPSNDFEITEESTRDLVGNAERVQEALREFRNQDSTKGPCALVLVGIPGVGKTTVGDHSAAALKREGNYEELNCCRISMRGEGSEISVKEKQEELYQRLSKRQKSEFADIKDGQRKLTKLFQILQQDKPHLMYFDDVVKSYDLCCLLPDHLNEFLHPASILLVTSTDEGVITVLEAKGVRCRLYKIRELQAKDAKKLLLKRICGGWDVPDNSPIAIELLRNQEFRQVLHYCGGVPLAIEVVGRYIWNRGQNYLRERCGELALPDCSFETTYSQLSETRRAGLLGRLKTAIKHADKCLYDGDPMGNNSISLDRSLEFACKQLACSQRIMEVFLEIVEFHSGRYWEDVELICGADNLETLKQMSLVKRVGSLAVVDVHPLLIGVARRLHNTNSSSRPLIIVGPDADLPECFQDDRNPATYESEVIKITHCKVSARQLDRVIRCARHFECYHTNITDKCTEIPQKLIFWRSRQSNFPFNLLQFPKLVFLEVDLGMDTTTSNLESFQSMPELQKLKLENSTSFKELGPKLPKLRIVDISNCPNFKRIRGLHGTSVQAVRIVRCPNFVDFGWITGLSCLERLFLSGFDFKVFPQDLVIPSRVQIMDLSRNQNLELLPTVVSKQIKKVYLRYCSRLGELSKEMMPSSSLEYLDLVGCAALKRLPLFPDELPMLKVVDVQGCHEIDRSQLRESYDKMKSRNPTFKMIGFRPNDEDYVTSGCHLFPQYFRRWTLKTGYTFPEKAPERSLKVSQTFPQRQNEKFREFREFKDRLAEWIRETRDQGKFWEFSRKLYKCLCDRAKRD